MWIALYPFLPPVNRLVQPINSRWTLIKQQKEKISIEPSKIPYNWTLDLTTVNKPFNDFVEMYGEGDLCCACLTSIRYRMVLTTMTMTTAKPISKVTLNGAYLLNLVFVLQSAFAEQEQTCPWDWSRRYGGDFKRAKYENVLFEDASFSNCNAFLSAFNRSVMCT